MGATRTQVYLTAEQRERIDAICEAQGKTLAEVVREALDRFLTDGDDGDAEEILRKTFGAAADLKAPSRDEWDRG